MQAIEKNAEQVLWVGSQNGIETDLVKREAIDFTAIPAAGVHGVGLKAMPGNILKILHGVFASRNILRGFKPDVILFTGGFVAVPMALASGRINKLLYVPDIEPGLALKFLSKRATRIAVNADKSKVYFSGNADIIITGYPLRPELKKWTKEKGQERFDLTKDCPVLLFLGGSKGARSINRALEKILPQLLEEFQVIHISGKLDWPEIESMKAGLTPELSARYRAFPYLHEDMGAALASADLVISRSGASTLGEYPYFGLPAILVPYPHAWRYQKVNAEYLVNNNAAMMLEDNDLEKDLYTSITALFDQPEKLQSMQAAMKKLAIPDASNKIADLLMALSGNKKNREATE